MLVKGGGGGGGGLHVRLIDHFGESVMLVKGGGGGGSGLVNRRLELHVSEKHLSIQASLFSN